MSWSEFLLSFHGRIGRKPYWLYTLAAMVVTMAVNILDAANGSGALGMALAVLLIWPGLAVSAKRWHDRGKSGWWNLVWLIPFIGWLWVIVECGFLPGDEGPNRFGDSPTAPPAFA